MRLNKYISTMLVALLVVFVGLTLNACGVDEITSIVVVGDTFVEYYENETDKPNNDVSVHITFKSGKNFDVEGTDSRITIEDFRTDIAGSRTMKITFTDEKSSVFCNLSYVVYAESQTIHSETEITKIDENNTVFFPNNMTLDMTDHAIDGSTQLIARNGKKVVLKNINIITNEAQDREVKLSNIILTNAKSDENALTVNGNGKVDLTISNCTISANGNCRRGILANKKGKFVIQNSTFETKFDNDIFTSLIYFDYSRDENAETIIKGNKIICQFEYGLQNLFNAVVENNYVNATLTATGIGAYVKDANSQKTFVAKKNPVFIHCYLPDRVAKQTDGKVFLKVNNNTLINLQNFLRIYQLDMFDYETQTEFVFSKNTYENIAVLLNTSQLSYANLSNLLADLKKESTQGCREDYKAVIEKDTEIIISENMVSEEIAISDSCVYYDFNDQSTNYATITVSDKDYIYVGKAGKLIGLTESSCYILKDKEADEYVVISKISYSPNGDVAYYMAENGFVTDIAGAKVFDGNTIKTLLGLLG